MLNYGFSELGLEKLDRLTAEENSRPIKILEKLGFKLQEKFLFKKKQKHANISRQMSHDNLLNPSTYLWNFGPIGVSKSIKS